jgi:hypothetical protein
MRGSGASADFSRRSQPQHPSPEPRFFPLWCFREGAGRVPARPGLAELIMNLAGTGWPGGGEYPGAGSPAGGRLGKGSPPPGAQPCKSALASPGITKYLCLKWRRNWAPLIRRARNCLGGSGFPVCAFPGFKCEPHALRVLGRLARGSCGLPPTGLGAPAALLWPGRDPQPSGLPSQALHGADFKTDLEFSP